MCALSQTDNLYNIKSVARSASESDWNFDDCLLYKFYFYVNWKELFIKIQYINIYISS